MPEKVLELLFKADSENFDKKVFDATGIFVVRNVIPENIMLEWQAEWSSFYESNLSGGRNVNKNNPVDLKEQLPEKLSTLYKHESVLNLAEQVFGENVALYNSRFVIKDKYSPGEVFLHQDFCYHLGWPNKASFFVALSYAGKKNGGLTFYAGSHQYGFLGDAGEVNPGSFAEKWPEFTPEMNPGDVAIMNSMIWHTSGKNEAGIDRIVADIILQPADDPSGKEILRGKWQTDFFINRENNPVGFFKWSRVTKIAKLEKMLNENNIPI